jgi:UDP-N-acetylmuramate dehydrogenase
MKIYNDFSLKSYNTFGLNYRCNRFIEVEFAEEIYSINNKFCLNESRFLVVGEGSNILFTKDFEGTVLHPTFNSLSLLKEDKDFFYFLVEAGKNWDEFVRFTVKKKLGGIENLISIPGLVGAAPIQNIGAYGQEVKDVIESVNFFDFSDNLFKSLPNHQCLFSYRNSIFKSELKNKVFITSVELRLKKNPKPSLEYGNVKEEITNRGIVNPSIEDVSNVISEIRNKKLPSPNVIGNAGSFFKNPIINKTKFDELKRKFIDIPFFVVSETQIKIPAAWLIERVGYKGKVKGNVATYHKQPLVIVNLGNASGTEILDFANDIREKIYNEFEITLETEVNII